MGIIVVIRIVVWYRIISFIVIIIDKVIIFCNFVVGFKIVIKRFLCIVYIIVNDIDFDFFFFVFRGLDNVSLDLGEVGEWC